MSRLIERNFDPAKPVLARRFFVAAGRHYNPGDTFDWKRLSVDQRRVKLLFDAGKLLHPDTPFASPAPASASAPAIAQEMQDEDVHRSAVTATAADEQPAPAEQVDDGLDDLDMKALRAIADAENAPLRVSRDLQRKAIRENRRAKAGN
jgi:hypothetical protein